MILLIGWRVTNEGKYKIPLPPLSEEEEEVLLFLEKKFRDMVAEGNLKYKDKELKRAIDIVSDDLNVFIDIDQRNYLYEYAKHIIYGFSFFDYLLEDEEIEEISVIGVNKNVFVFIKNKGWKKTNVIIEDESFIMDIVNRMSSKIGRRITLQNPRLDAVLPNGSRLHASLYPISNGEITIRKFRKKLFTPKELVELKTTDIKTMAILSLIMQIDSSVIIAGNTASGKTTTLNALFSFIPKNERILITEESPEIQLPHEHQIRLIANKDMGISLKDLVYDSLRMRPDRMIVGEVKNKEEVEALFDVLFGGQARGAYATFHAQSSEEAILRLKKFGIDEEDIKSIDAIIIQRRLLKYDIKKRKNIEMRKIIELYDPKSKKQIIKNKNSFIIERIKNEFNISEKELEEEINYRSKLIKETKGDIDEFINKIQNELYGL